MNTSLVTSRVLPAAELRRRWQRMLADPLLAEVPGKLELSERGAIELSPSSTQHGIVQAFVASELRRQRPDGVTITECAIETALGIRVADVAWASSDFMRRHRTESPLRRSPELCVEVLSQSNSQVEMQQKAAAYLAAGALEVWLVKENGLVEMLTAEGPTDRSALGIAIDAESVTPR